MCIWAFNERYLIGCWDIFCAAIEINLRLPSMIHGKKGFERIVWAFNNVLNDPVTWIFHNFQHGSNTINGSKITYDYSPVAEGMPWCLGSLTFQSGFWRSNHPASPYPQNVFIQHFEDIWGSLAFYPHQWRHNDPARFWGVGYRNTRMAQFTCTRKPPNSQQGSDWLLSVSLRRTRRWPYRWIGYSKDRMAWLDTGKPDSKFVCWIIVCTQRKFFFFFFSFSFLQDLILSLALDQSKVSSHKALPGLLLAPTRFPPVFLMEKMPIQYYNAQARIRFRTIISFPRGQVTKEQMEDLDRTTCCGSFLWLAMDSSEVYL